MCALFGGQRDVSLVRTINKELMCRIIDTNVLYYKLVLNDSATNVYEESVNQIYYTPMKIHAHIAREDPVFENNEVTQDYTVNTRFAFLRELLFERDLVCEVGDIIYWDNEYYEVDTVIENKYWTQKNPFTDVDINLDKEQYGHSVSIICDAHVTRRNRIETIEKRSGINQ